MPLKDVEAQKGTLSYNKFYHKDINTTFLFISKSRCVQFQIVNSTELGGIMICSSESQWQQESNFLNQDKFQIRDKEGLSNRKQEQSEQRVIYENQHVMQFFFDSNKFLQLFNAKSNQCIVTELLWKIHFFLGQTILKIQNQLLQKQTLKQWIPLNFSQIQKVTSFLFDRARRSPRSEALQKIRTLLHQLSTSKNWDLQKMIEVYAKIIKISRKTHNFQVLFENAYKKSLRQDGKNSDTLVFEIQDLQAIPKSKIKSQNARIEMQKIMSTIKRKPHSKKTDYNNQRLEAGFSKGRITEAKQAIICRAYSETKTSQECIQVIEKQLGLDMRWSYPNQVQAKLECIIIKLFHKFQHMKSNNTCIQTFVRNRKKVFAVVQYTLKRQIFKGIASIYFHLINKTNDSRRIISEKMNEVNRLCQEVII